jgi:hypothetical protein
MWVDLFPKAFPQPKHLNCCIAIGLTNFFIVNFQVKLKGEYSMIEMISSIGSVRSFIIVTLQSYQCF